MAVDTPNGLVVPVIRDVEKKGLLELARELGEMSERMRAGKIAPTDLQGGCFSISSLGGIGGNVLHADHQCAGSRDPRRRQGGDEAGLERQRIRAAPHAAAVAVCTITASSTALSARASSASWPAAGRHPEARA